MGVRWVVLLGALGCGGGTAPESEPTATPQAVGKPPLTPAAHDPCVPPVDYRLPEQESASPLATTGNEALTEARSILEKVVRDHGRDPQNPWAVSHAMLALGPDIELTNGVSAIDWLFSEYAEAVEVGGVPGLSFPSRRGPIRIEPHADLLLKAFTEAGVSPQREVQVAGATHRLHELYDRSLCAAWVDGDTVSGRSWNDMPWTLQAVSTWAPRGLSWTADGGHEMTIDGLTSSAVTRLAADTAFLREARAQGQTVSKRNRQGIFTYTCGGAHLVQGVTWAVGQGFGTPEDRAVVAREIDLYLWRIDVELDTVDALIVHPQVASDPNKVEQLRIQRLKFLGHVLETTHKAAALGLVEATPARAEALARVETELVATVQAMRAAGGFDRLEQTRARNEQIYLDYIGDAAHALRGIALHTGTVLRHGPS